MLKQQLEKRIILLEEMVLFNDYTKLYGRAAFEVCPLWKRGKLARLTITPRQQPDAHYYYVVEVGNSTELCFSVLYLRDSFIPVSYLQWCAECKTTSLRFNAPEDSRFFSIQGGMTAIMQFSP